LPCPSNRRNNKNLFDCEEGKDSVLPEILITTAGIGNWYKKTADDQPRWSLRLTTAKCIVRRKSPSKVTFLQNHGGQNSATLKPIGMRGVDVNYYSLKTPETMKSPVATNLTAFSN